MAWEWKVSTVCPCAATYGGVHWLCQPAKPAR